MKNIKYVLIFVFMLVATLGIKTYAGDAQVSKMPVLLSIEITQPADKLSYLVGESLDISGLEVVGNYDDDTSKIENVTLSNITGFDNSKVGSQILTININGQFATYEISIEGELVNPDPELNTFPILQSIDITRPADKLSFNIGDSLDITGLEVTGNYLLLSNNSTFSQIEDVTLSNITGFDNSKIGSQILTIEINGQFTTYEINMEGELANPDPDPIPFPVLQSIEISHPANKLSFFVGDSLDITGLEVTGHYLIPSLNTSFTKIEDIILSNITGFDNSKVGSQVLQIEISGKSTSYTVDIKNRRSSGGSGGKSGTILKPLIGNLITSPISPLVGKVLGEATFKFTKYLKFGSRGAEVTELQKRLSSEGLYTDAIDGIFGKNTKKAVIDFQTKNEINPIGVVGPLTRGALNK